MGRFTYDSSSRVEIEDRALAHLHLVMTSKLRRGESFSFSWRDDVSVGDGRTTVWVHPAANLIFKFYGTRRPTLNTAWLEALTVTANSATGLYMVPEPSQLKVRSPGTLSAT